MRIDLKIQKKPGSPRKLSGLPGLEEKRVVPFKDPQSFKNFADLKHFLSKPHVKNDKMATVHGLPSVVRNYNFLLSILR